LEKSTAEVPLSTAEQNARDVFENVPSSSVNPASGTAPSVQSSPRSDRKLPIHSLKDGLLGCPLEALQALAPEGYLQGGVGKTTPDRFADILVHHQIAVSFLCFLLFLDLSVLFSNLFFFFFFFSFFSMLSS
jgi:hypothetical protein